MKKKVTKKKNAKTAILESMNNKKSMRKRQDEEADKKVQEIERLAAIRDMIKVRAAARADEEKKVT